MAGDWIKVEHVTPGKPEIDQIADATALEADTVVGILIRVWIWADQQTLNGNAPSVTKKAIDRHAGVTGFAEAMQGAGWLAVGDAGVSFPHFDRHNGQTAKTRALTAKRVAAHKAQKGNAPSVTTALPKEEKRREEKSKKKNPQTPLQGAACEFSSRFLAWWDEYPAYKNRKTRKGDCYGLWKKQKLDATAEHVLAVLQAMKASGEWTRGDSKGPPAPYVWLNQKRWDCKLADMKPEQRATSIDLEALAAAEEAECAAIDAAEKAAKENRDAANHTHDAN